MSLPLQYQPKLWFSGHIYRARSHWNRVPSILKPVRHEQREAINDYHHFLEKYHEILCNVRCRVGSLYFDRRLRFDSDSGSCRISKIGRRLLRTCSLLRTSLLLGK